MPPTLRRVIIFDDEPYQLELRRLQAEAMLGKLARRGAISFDESYNPDDQVVACTQRVAVLELLAEDPDVLLLADMTADSRGPHAGNIGARLVRAVAQHPSTAQTTRRVMWSKHNVSGITDDLRRWTHAFALYDMQGEDDLADAVLHAYGTEDQPWTRPLEFPAARTPERWSDDVRAIIEELVDEPLEGDDLIAVRLGQRVPRAEINLALDRMQGDHRPSVQDFLDQVRRDRRLRSIEDAEDLVRLRIAPLAADQVPDPIRPQECESALAFRAELLTERPDSHRDLTWLTAAEDELLAKFLSLYRPAAQLHAAAENARVQAIQKILGGPFEDDLPHPEWAATAQRLGLGKEDLAYALWTMADVQMSR